LANWKKAPAQTTSEGEGNTPFYGLGGEVRKVRQAPLVICLFHGYDQRGSRGPINAASSTGVPPGFEGKPLRYEKAETILRIALDMQGSPFGLSLEDIQRNYSDEPLSRRTAERLRDTVERLFPQLQQANPNEVPKRWRLPGGTLNGLANITADELADLATAVELFRREHMSVQADSAKRVISKIRALLKRPLVAKIEPDLEALTEAEGLAMRPGPRPKINSEIIGTLRQAIITRHKVRLHYLSRRSRRRRHLVVRPYGFLYGSRHYLVAWSNRAKDFRNFALSNIERVRVLDRTFTRKSDFSLRDYAQRSFGVFQENPVDVVLRFAPTAAIDAREFLFHPTQVLQPQPDGSLIVQFHAGGLLEMSWHLFTWQGQVEILRPERLAARLRDQIENWIPTFGLGLRSSNSGY
jgi:predicted DNA-binding transcriptional regulator YafY